MKDIKSIKKKLRHSSSTNEINEILIEISKNPNEFTLSIIDFLFQILDIQQLNNVKINLVYLIGKASQIVKLDTKYIDFLVNSYYESDRWVRNEIIQAFYNIVKSGSYLKSINEVLETALKEDYEPIQDSSLKVFNLYKNLEESSLKSIMSILGTKNTDRVNLALKILKKEITNEEKLFNFLNNHQNYKLLNKSIVRVLIIEFLTTISQLETFQEKILNSDWEEKVKVTFNSEINTLEKILLQRRI